MTFDAYIGIDYSGAETGESRIKGLQVYEAAGGPPRRIIAHPEQGRTHGKWSRREVPQHLIDLAGTDVTLIAGLDHSFGLPLSYFERYDLRIWQNSQQ